MPAGRPSGFKPEYCEQVIALGKEGKSKAQIAAKLGVVRNTLDNWAENNPEFLNALNSARDAALAWWEEQGQAGLTADKFNATAFISQMKNRFPQDYRDRQEISGPDGGPIDIRNDKARQEEIDALLRPFLPSQPNQTIQ